jgi:hypothetical protein
MIGSCSNHLSTASARRLLHGTKRVYTMFGLAPWGNGLGGRPISANVTFEEHVKGEQGNESEEVISWIVKDFFAKREI